MTIEFFIEFGIKLKSGIIVWMYDDDYQIAVNNTLFMIKLVKIIIRLLSKSDDCISICNKLRSYSKDFGDSYYG